MKTTRVLLVDDHQLVRAGMRALIDRLAGFEVVGEAGDGRESLQLAAKLQPDLILMDVLMPELDGVDATARLAAVAPHARVLMLSMNADVQYVLRALQGGAAGYLLKNTGPAELELAMRAVARGETYLSPAVSKHVIDGYVRRADVSADPLDRLTPRQREVLQLIAEGATTKEIARKLNISPKTAETHRAQLMQELDVHEIAGLVRFAIRHGLVSPDT
jgi:DNA-binding NarL/FixJ family response regulator